MKAGQKLTLGAQQFLAAQGVTAGFTAQQEAELEKIKEPVIDEAQIARVIGNVSDQAAPMVQGKACRHGKTRWLGRTEVEKLEQSRERPPAPPPRRVRYPRPRDPIRGTLEVHKGDKAVILVNSSRWEKTPEAGKQPRPQFLQVIARTSGNYKEPQEKDYKALQRRLEAAGFLSLAFHANGEDEALKNLDLDAIKALDIKWISAKDAVVEIEDRDEHEFDAGSGINAIALGANGLETSRDLAIDPDNKVHRIVWWTRNAYSNDIDYNRTPKVDEVVPVEDTTPPDAYQERVQMFLAAKRTMPRGTWLDTKGAAKYLNACLRVGAGFLKEPSATGTVSFMDQSVALEVDKDDRYGVGSLPKTRTVKLDEDHSIRSIMNQMIQSEWQRVETDRATKSVRVSSNYFSGKNSVDGITLTGRKIQPLGRPVAFRENMDGVVATKSNSCQGKGQEFTIRLTKDFLSSEDPSRLKGWTIDVGRRVQTEKGEEWVPASRNGTDSVLKLDGKDWPTRAAKFTMDIEDFEAEYVSGKAPPFEILIYNAEGMPVESIRIPIEKVDWE